MILRVAAGLSLVLGTTALSGYLTLVGKGPFAPLEALKGGVQRSVVDEKRAFGLLLDRARDALTVLVAEDQDPQDEEIQCPLEQGDPFVIVLGRHATRVSARLGRMST